MATFKSPFSSIIGGAEEGFPFRNEVLGKQFALSKLPDHQVWLVGCRP